MNTTTVTAAHLHTESAFRRIARALLAELRKSLAFMGHAYSQGLPPF